MRRYAKWLVTCGAMMVAVPTVGWGLPATGDPNAGLLSLQRDPRLSRKVSLHGLGVPVDEVLVRVSQATGVRLKADATISDIRLDVLVDDVKAASLLSATIQMMGYSVRADTTIEGTGAAYRILRSQADRALEQQKRETDLRDFRRRMQAWQLYGAVPEADLERFWRDHRDAFPDVYSTMCNMKDGRRLGLLLAGLSAGQTEQLYRGEPIVRPFAELPVEARKLLVPALTQDLGKGLFAFTNTSQRELWDPRRANTAPPLPEAVVAGASVTLWIDTELAGTDRAMHARVSNVDLGAVPPEIWRALQRERAPAVAWGREYRFGGRGPDSGISLVPNSRIAALRKEWRERYPLLREELSRKLPRHTELPPWAQMRSGPALWALHRAAEIPIVAEHLVRVGDSFQVGETDAVGDALSLYQGLFRCTWRPIEGLHTLRDDYWYFPGLRTIATRSLREWQRVAEERGEYPTEVVCSIAQLSDTQITLLEAYGLLPGLARLAREADLRAAYRLWGRLDTRQRRVALGAGLPMAALTRPQMEAIVLSASLPFSPRGLLMGGLGSRGSLALLFQAGAGVRREVRIGPLVCPLLVVDPEGPPLELRWLETPPGACPPTPEAPLARNDTSADRFSDPPQRL